MYSMTLVGGGGAPFDHEEEICYRKYLECCDAPPWLGAIGPDEGRWMGRDRVS